MTCCETFFLTRFHRDESKERVPPFDKPWHYCVVDVKFSTLHLSASGELGNSGSLPSYKVQLHTYNKALGRLQDYEPKAAFLLGRGWDKTVHGETLHGPNCMELLAKVDDSTTVTNKVPVSDAAEAAQAWIRRLRAEGDQWTPLPDPTQPELYPNMTNQQDAPWHLAKREIAEELEELTLLWQVGLRGRSLGHEAGVFRWTDVSCNPGVVGVTGPSRGPVLQELLDINQTTNGPPVRPVHISAAGQIWRSEPGLEFYVDFEATNDLADDFSTFPLRGGQPLIFMIGCGHLEHGEWQYECFLADQLAEDAEALIIQGWLDHMETVKARLAPGQEPLVIHWSPAETVTFETAYNSAKERHPNASWGTPRWFDFLNLVVKAEPVVVRGAMAFGLKAVAKALHSHGNIETLWEDGPTDGLGAMIGAWWSYQSALQEETEVSSSALMQQIADYNEVDCKVMMEAVGYLRQNH